MEMENDEVKKMSQECRNKNENMHQWACYGIIYMCHCFMKEDGHLLYFIPMLFSVFSICADWCSNWRFYKPYEKEGKVLDFNENWCLVPAGGAILSFAILYLHYNLLIKIG